MYSFF